MINDIVEREVAEPKAPKAPTQSNKIWRPKVGRSKSGQAAKQVAPPEAIIAPAAEAATPPKEGPPLSQQEQIHLENLRKMSQMSAEEIESERRQLIDSMDPNVLASLLKRAEIKEQTLIKPTSVPSEATSSSSPPSPSPSQSGAPQGGPMRGPRFNSDHNGALSDPQPETRENNPQPPPANDGGSSPPHSSLHFPSPPDDLKKYFPDTPVETSKLAWMQPVAPEEELEYSEELESVAPSQLRFDFRGNLLTPRQSNRVDTSVGLHHHADAPGAAGYTIPELAHLSRSSHASQRSIAIQTLGRVLHKLVNGNFNKSSELQYGLQQLVQSTRVEETLLEAASDQTRSLTVRAHATEALWLYHNRAVPTEN